MEKNVTMDKIINLCKSRGFVFSGSEIYGGLANSWDYGPLGSMLKNNLKSAWIKRFVTSDPNNFELDSAILMNPEIWKASGHLTNFNDPLMDCRECRARLRGDQLIEDYALKKNLTVNIGSMTNEEMSEFIQQNKVKCPVCGNSNFTPIRKFNMMFKTFQGVTEDSTNTIYLRPETAQGIFVNFKNITRSMRSKIPFGVGQYGKCFRNEITPGNFIFRTREFEQLELEFFCKPGTELEWFNHYQKEMKQFLLDLGFNESDLRFREHEKEELSFYSNATTDVEFLFPFGWGELWGIASRTDYDLKAHQKASGESMEYLDPETNEKYIPYVVEPSLGLTRLLLSTLCSAYKEETLEGGDTRVVLRFKPFLAPYKLAILPLQKNMKDKSDAVYRQLSKYFSVTTDISGSIGKRYRRQDEIGTPYCLTIDFETLENDTVTIRDRDTMEQIRLPLSEVKEYIEKSLIY